MTTANLSVGLKTDSARQSLREFKAWAKSEMKGVLLSINDDALTNSVQAALKRQKFKIDFDASALKASTSKALGDAFATRYQIKLDTGNLTDQVKAAVSAGVGGVKLSGGQSGGFSPDIKTAIQQTLTPAIDELAKAAVIVGGTARKIGAQGTPGAVSASRSISGTDAEGFRTTYRQKLPEPDAVLAQTRASNAAKEKLEADELNAAGERQAQLRRRRAAERGEEINAIGERQELIRQFRARQAAEELNEQGQRQSAMRSLRARQRGEELNELGQRQADLRQARARQAGEELNEQGQRQSALRSLRSRERGQELNDVGQRQELLRQIRARQAGEEMNESGLRAQMFARRRAQEAGEEINAAGQRAAQLQARRKERAQELAEVMAHFDRLKAAAARQYTGRGASISAAAGVAGIYGEGRAREALGARQSGLLGEVGTLGEYERKMKAVVPVVKQAADNHKAFRDAANDAHSAARGLAGSLGMLWVTWGSTVPLVAAASLGAAIRSVYTNGKDLEYQLAFVSVLTDRATISTERFAQAVRGSLTAPVQAAEALRGLAQNGLSAQQALMALPAILNLATAGEMSLSDAALGATGVMAAFNLQVTDLGRIGDVFAKAAALSNTNVQGMVEAMKQASTVSDQYKVSLEETAATLAVMAKRNISGTAAGTAFRNMMVEVATPTEKAKRSMDVLGLSIYDNNNQLKDYGAILQQVREKTILLNEKSKLEFLNNVFGERGAKAINAVLSDYQLYLSTLDEVKTKSSGFSESVTAALSETTEGKIKALVSEFQLSTATAFDSAKNSANIFIDTLRTATSSNEFRQGLAGLASNLGSVATFLVEHAGLFVQVIAIYKVYQVTALATAAATAAMGYQASAATFMFGGLAVSAKVLLGTLTLGIATIATLGLEWLLLSKHTDEATEAQKAFTLALEKQNDKADSALERLRSENTLLARRNELMLAGKSATDAQKQAERELGNGEALDAKQRLDQDKAKLAAAEQRMRATESEDLAISVSTGIAQRSAETIKAAEEVENLTRRVKEQTVAYEKSQAVQAATLTRDGNADIGNRLAKIQALREEIRAVDEASKGKIKLAGIEISEAEALRGTAAEFESLLKKRQAELNSRKQNVTLPSPELRANDAALSRGVIEKARAEEEALRRRLRLQRELEEAKYSSTKFGTELTSVLSEQRSRQGIADSMEVERKTIALLNAEKGRANFKAADRQNIENEIETRRRRLDALREELTARTQIDAYKARNRQEDAATREQKYLTSQAVKDAEQLQKINTKYALKIIDPVEAARAAAELDAIQNYAQGIAEQEDNVLRIQEARSVLLREWQEASAEERANANERLTAVERQLDIEKQVLATRRERSGAAGSRAGSAAAAAEADSRTAEYGMKKFWTDYRNSAESSAKAVYDLMKTTTDGMSNMVATFATTGKFHFKDFARGVLAEAVKVMSSRALLQLLSMGMGLVGGMSGSTFAAAGSSGGSGAGAFNGSAGSGFGATYSANGNVMTQYGAMNLRKYDAGGVAYTPQLSVFGEGRKPEAYVPLNDGRTIPVTVSGGAGGGGVMVNQEIHIHGDGRSEASTDVSGQKGAQLANLIKDSTLRTIAEQQRPGGLLYGG